MSNVIHNSLTNTIVLQTTRINGHSTILRRDFTITLGKSLVSQYQHISHVIPLSPGSEGQYCGAQFCISLKFSYPSLINHHIKLL